MAENLSLQTSTVVIWNTLGHSKPMRKTGIYYEYTELLHAIYLQYYTIEIDTNFSQITVHL